ncbi:hypothetical protein BC826DRAFT_971107 [Russula brevipes]|nr:hypothetical protein BC826DRAFT_971107 [Russula brevipes]
MYIPVDVLDGCPSTTEFLPDSEDAKTLDLTILICSPPLSVWTSFNEHTVSWSLALRRRTFTRNEVLGEITRDDFMDQLPIILDQTQNRCPWAPRSRYTRPSFSACALANCLKPRQLPIFVVVDALDECPSTTGTPSAREKVLDVIEDLVCRAEQDIQNVLNPSTTASRRVFLHKESGQREDINNYIRSFVATDRAMRRWRKEDRELVITTLSERAA